MSEILPVLILIGRPAAGKSEVIDFLQKTDETARRMRFHIGRFREIDDFPYIWDWFEEDDILERHGRERLHTTSDYYFKDEFLWNVCIEKINLAFTKLERDKASLGSEYSAIVEFARGGEHGFADAFSYLSDEILSRAGILYLKVSYEESVRKNRRRARKGLEDSVLHHSLPDDKMEHYYRINDWDRLAPDPDGFLEVRGHRVPYAVLANEPEVTDDPSRLEPALEESLGRLWTRMNESGRLR
jgi:hypothetical protein